MKYNLIFRFKTGDLISEVRKVEDEVNNTMMNFGFSEKMFLQSEVPILTITSDRALSEEEKSKLVQVVEKEFQSKDLTKDWEFIRIEESED